MAGLNTCIDPWRPLRRNPDRTGKLRAWVILSVWVGALILFIYVVGPAGLETHALKPVADVIAENQINANAYDYTEVEEFFSAERHMREYLKLVPGSER